jgi:hypothetical protein
MNKSPINMAFSLPIYKRNLAESMQKIKKKPAYVLNKLKIRRLTQALVQLKLLLVLSHLPQVGRKVLTESSID